MSKFLKRMLSFLLTACVAVGAALPLTVSAFESVYQYPDFNPDLFAADVITGETEYDVAYNDLIKKIVEDSPAVKMAQEMKSISGFETTVKAWDALTYKFSDQIDKPLSEIDYYEMIILSSLELYTSADKVKRVFDNKVIKTSKSALDSAKDILKVSYGIVFTEKIPDEMVKDLTNEQLTKLFNDTYKDLFPKMDKMTTWAKNFSTAVKMGKSFEQSILTYSALFECYELEESMKQFIDDLVAKCPDDNQNLKLALTHIQLSCMDKDYGLLENSIELIGKPALVLLETKMDKFFSTTLGSNPFLAGILIGQSFGKDLSNFLFSTDSITEEYYHLVAFSQYESLVKKVTLDCIVNYKSDHTEENAHELFSAVDVLFTSYDVGCDTVKKMFDHINKENVFSFLLNLFSKSAREDYNEGIESIQNLKKDNNATYKYVRDYSYYFALSRINPEIYQIVVDRGEFTLLLEPVSEGNCGANVDNVTYKLYENGVLVISGTGNMRDYDYNCNSPFHKNTDIKVVVIEDGVTCIGNYAFHGCTALTNITIPDSVTSIGYSAFRDCSELTHVLIPDGVETIEGYAFYCCSKLNYIYIPDSVTSIGTESFGNCIGLTSVFLPYGVTSIGYGAFVGCTELRSISIPDSVTWIDSMVFFNCSKLTSINVDENNPAFCSDEGVLFNKSKTKLLCCPGGKTGTYIIPDGVKSVGRYAFGECRELTGIVLPDTLTEIGNWAFYYCSGLTDVTIPDSVTSIGASAFWSCSGLTSVTIGNSVTSIGDSAFLTCTGLTSVIIPDSVTTIEWDAFYGCSQLESIVIPESVTYIAGNAFKECRNFRTIYGVKGSYAESFCCLYNFVEIIEHKDEIPATCMSSGKQSYYHNHLNDKFYADEDCSIEIININAWGVIPSTGHNYELINEKAVNCIEDGEKEYKCSNCGETKTETISATGHSYTEEIVSPACTEQGYTLHTCTICGDSFKDNYTVATGHSYELTSEKASTCTENGEKIYKCNRCGETKTETIESTGHSYTTKTIAPTCTEQGYTLHTCTICGDSYKDSYTVETGHSYELTSEKAPTCTENGEKTYTCTRCGETKNEIVNAKGHNLVHHNAKPATETESGWEAYDECTKCDYSTFKTVPMLLSNKTTLSKTSFTVGETLKITGAASGGTAPYTYEFYYKRSGASSWTRFGSGSSASFKPGSAGSFVIRTYVKDSTGKAAKKDFELTASAAALANNTTVSKTSFAVGETVKITGAASGGTAPYTYEFYYKRSGASSWTRFGSGSSASFKPGSAGSFVIRTYVKDSTGKAAKKDFELTASAAALANNTTVSKTSFAVGETVKITGAASGGTAPYTYEFYYKRSGASNWTRFGSGSSASFKPSSAGTFIIRTYAKDAAGGAKVKDFTLTAK